MKRILTLFLLTFTLLPVTAQEQPVDSLINILQTGTPEPAKKLSLYDKISGILVNNDIEKAKTYVEEGLVLAEKEKDLLMISKFNTYFGWIYLSLTAYDTSMEYYQKALDLAIKAENKEQEADIYTRIGVLYDRQGQFASVLEYYMKALALYEETGDKAGYMKILANIGGTHRTLNNYDRAIYYLEQARTMAEEAGNLPVKLKVYFDLGGIYMFQGDTDKAIEYELEAAEISRTIGYKGFEASCMQALAIIYYMNLENYEEALKYAEEGLRLSQELGERITIAGTWMIISNIYRDQNRWFESEAAATNAWEADSTNLEQIVGICHNLAMANLYLDNKEKARYFLNEYENTVRQRIDKSFHDSLIDTEVKYETAKKEIRIAVLEKEKEFHTWLSVAGVFVLLLVIILLIFAYRLNVQKRKLAEQQILHLEQEKQLIATKAVLEGETAERSRLARDLHDGLGGTLSVIKLNLKGIKTYSMMDTSDIDRFNHALTKLEQSIGEVRRVAHNMMPESLFRDGLKTAIECFCEDIPNAHFQFFGEEKRLESNLEILFYRCAYELINNAMKYADAKSIHVQLIIDKELVSLTVLDDGSGFSPDDVTRGTGLNNIRARVASCNGKMNLYSSPGNGTEACIEVELPHVEN
jgi:signal transduction histidine kinase/Tfp pilus assembly protein PilF